MQITKKIYLKIDDLNWHAIHGKQIITGTYAVLCGTLSVSALGDPTFLLMSAQLFFREAIR